MDSSPNGKLEKYFRAIALCIFFFMAIALIYYQFVYIPQKKAEYIRSITPVVAEERNYLTAGEDKEMRAAYEEIMLKKYGKKVDLSGTSSTSLKSAVKKK